MKRNLNADYQSAILCVLQVKPVHAAVEAFQTSGCIGESDAVTQGGFLGAREPRAVVADFQVQRSVLAARDYMDPDCRRLRIGSMADGILDERLEQKRRHQGSVCIRTGI